MPSNIKSDLFQHGIIVKGGIEVDYVVIEPRFVTTATTTLHPNDNVIFVESGVATTLTLPSNPEIGTTLIIKDMNGVAATYNVTINPATSTVSSPLTGDGMVMSGSIDGASSLVMNTNYASVTLIFNGTNWSIV